MIRTRLWVGSLLALLAAGLLIGDRYFSPWFPCLLGCLILVGYLAARELVALFPAVFRPSASLTVAGVLITILANWYNLIQREFVAQLPPVSSAWVPVLFAFVGSMAAGFLLEMARYREPGAAVQRLGLTVFGIAYLGLFASFLAQLRWVDPDPYRSSWILTLTIFVPKCGDIGAFFTGTFLGRHKMTPILSPKKTWEGFSGGIVVSMLAAVGLGSLGQVFSHGIGEAAVFGLVVGFAGVVGDLAESLIKRDCQTKDAARSIPGFGGLLDVIDSVLFAAPVAYLWFSRY